MDAAAPPLLPPLARLAAEPPFPADLRVVATVELLFAGRRLLPLLLDDEEEFLVETVDAVAAELVGDGPSRLLVPGGAADFFLLCWEEEPPCFAIVIILLTVYVLHINILLSSCYRFGCF